MELEVTWRRAVRVWWAYLWRAILSTVVAMIIGAIAGAILGVVIAVLGAPARLIQIIGYPLGLVIGLPISLVPIKLILGKDFGDFRLVLLAKEPAPVPWTAAPSDTPAEIR